MAGTVTTYVQPMTQPLEGLQNSFTQLASQHRDINSQLRNHANDLISGSGLNFKGAGAQAFSGLVNYYVDTSEKHMKCFDDAAGAVQTCHSTITTASVNADGAGLHPGLTNHVLSQVSHNDIIERGSEPIWAVVNDMLKTIGDMLHQGGSFFGDVFTGNFSGAWDALKKEWGDLGNLGSDAMSLVQDVGRVLGSWADTVWNAVKTCASFIGRILWDVADFVLGISSIINDVKVLFDPHKSLWDKLLAAGDLVLNVGMDVSMFFGVGEALKGGELLIKGGIDLGEKFMEDGGKDILVNLFKGDGTEQFMKKVADLDGDEFFKSLDPETQKIVKGIQQISRDSQTKLDKLVEQVVNKGDTPLRDAVEGFDDLGKRTQAFLKLLSRQDKLIEAGKGWLIDAHYGNALQELAENGLKDQGLVKEFGLEFRKGAPEGLEWLKKGGIPDIKWPLGDKEWNIGDWTTDGESGKIVKYASNQVKYLIEFIYKR